MFKKILKLIESDIDNFNILLDKLTFLETALYADYVIYSFIDAQRGEIVKIYKVLETSVLNKGLVTLYEALPDPPIEPPGSRWKVFLGLFNNSLNQKNLLKIMIDTDSGVVPPEYDWDDDVIVIFDTVIDIINDINILIAEIKLEILKLVKKISEFTKIL